MGPMGVGSGEATPDGAAAGEATPIPVDDVMLQSEDEVEVGLPAALAGPEGLAIVPAAPAMHLPEPIGDFVVRLPFGDIRYYHLRKEMVAHCPNPRHGNHCRLSRKTTPHLSAKKAGQGRPAGLLAAWLRSAHLLEF
eukprot:5172123-Heterocapsa_arctica.AAC.1